MWRIERPDGTLSDMVNLTRAQDAALSAALSILNGDAKQRRSEAAGSDSADDPVPDSPPADEALHG
jgi:hypothetical protein